MASNYGRSPRGPSYGGPSTSSGHRPSFGGSSGSGGYRHSVGGPGGGSSHRPSVREPSSSSSSSHRPPPFSFLFVVNKLSVLAEDERVPHLDRWGNILPPYDRHAYVDEEPSRVMRYQGGQVTLAEGHVWHRPHGTHTRGYIVGPSRSSGPNPTSYKVKTVFSCNPFLPIVAVPEDMTTHDMDGRNGLRWDMLRFEHETQQHPGISFAACGQEGHYDQPRQYVAGRSPSWIPGLVPEIYRSQRPVPDSRGLSGDLPLLLALMSFFPQRSTPHDLRMERVFYSRHALWRNRCWCIEPMARPQGYSRCEDTPHGFLVQVCLDNVYNPGGSTLEAMRAFEKSIIVRDER